jgi:hypothetical protein
MLCNIFPVLCNGEGKESKEIDDKSSQYCFPWGICEHPPSVSLLAAVLVAGATKGDAD